MRSNMRAATVVFPVLSLIALAGGHATRLSVNAVIEPSQATPENQNIMLKVGYVEANRVTFSSLVPTWDIRVRESEFLKYYEVIIWEETASVHLYEFPNDFDRYYGYDIRTVDEDGFVLSYSRNEITDQQKIAYREQFLISRYIDMPEAWTNERSTFLKSAFMDVASYLVNRHPVSDHHMKFNGHGGPGGQLFSGHLQRDHAYEFLKFWSVSLGKPLGVIDMGGPCNKGSFADLDNFCDSARYYIASDLLNGGYSMDEFTWAKREEVWPLAQYHRLFSANQGLEETLKGRIDLKRKAYEFSRNNMIANQVAQANYLYSCAEFRKFGHVFRPFHDGAGVKYGMSDDLHRFMTDNGAAPTLIKQFSKVIVHQADNRDFFEWSVVRNGMLMPAPGLLDHEEPRPQALTKVSGDGQEGSAGTLLDFPLEVEVRDQNGNVIVGAIVFFVVTAGGGNLSVSIAATDAAGRASATLILGRHQGTNTVEVTSGGLPPVAFSAESRATADFNGDGRTDFVDFFLFADAYGSTNAKFDLDGNGTVDFADFFKFVDAFGS